MHGDLLPVFHATKDGAVNEDGHGTPCDVYDGVGLSRQCCHKLGTQGVQILPYIHGYAQTCAVQQ